MAAPQTVALPALTTLDINQIIDPNYDKFKAFRRSLKVFERSFLQHNLFNIGMYQQMWIEYYNAMVELYDVANDPQLNQLDTTDIDAEVMNETIKMTVGVTEILLEEVMATGQVEVRFGHIQHVPNNIILHLNMTQRLQTGAGIELVINFNDLDFATVNDRHIEFKFTSGRVDNPLQDFPPFTIHYRQLHAEGFHRWFTFGSTKLLLRIEFESTEDPLKSNELLINSFHLNTLLLMIERRLLHFRSLPADDSSHIHSEDSEDREVTYVREEVDPTTREAFWGTAPDPNDNEDIDGPVKYTDLQFGFSFLDQFGAQEFCTCGEFCNLNAFFHYNPIYRFLLVQHNRHYIKNKTVVAPIYVLALTYSLPDLVFQIVPPRTPLIPLLISANNQLMKNNIRFMRDISLQNNFNASNPSATSMVGNAYLLLKKVSISEICRSTDINIPFSDNSFDYINNFYDILFSLHKYVGNKTAYVPRNQRKQWGQEFEKICRIHYTRYIHWSVDHSLTLQPKLDYLFTEDFECSSKLAQNTEQINQYPRWQYLQSLVNPFNVEFEVRPFTNVINNIWKSITYHKPLSRLYSSSALASESRFGSNICLKLNNAINAPNFNGNLIALTNPFPPELVPVRLILHDFYKMRTYSRVFQIQKQFCKSFLRYNPRQPQRNQLVFSQLLSIWKNQWIESMSYDLFHLFSSTNQYHQLIQDFYITGLGQSTHQTLCEQIQAVPQPNQVIDSVFIEYFKRRYWDQIDGQNSNRFRAILTEFSDRVQTFTTQTQNVYENKIMNAINTLRNIGAPDEQDIPEVDRHYVIVLDEIVYWLMRSVCFIIIGAVANFLNAVRRLENNILVGGDRQFLLCKPGFVYLFQTKLDALRIIDEITVRYIAFSDPFDNISITFDDTKELIKAFYKDFFTKLIYNWRREVEDIRHYPYFGYYPSSSNVLLCHMISGLSFMYYFVDDNRRVVNKNRKQLINRCLAQIPNTLLKINFGSIMQAFLLWIQNANMQDLVKPFRHPFWQQRQPQLFAALDAGANQLQAQLNQL